MVRNSIADIRREFFRKYCNNEFRIIGNSTQQSKTVEIQNACFIADEDGIIRKPNYEYFERELAWYESQSLNVNDIPGGAPKMWAAVADKDGYINSNYGWCIWSKDNGYQYLNAMEKLINDHGTREAIMIYNRPSMHTDFNKNGMHDFMCCQNMHYFWNDNHIDVIVNFRSNDAVFGYCNDYLWAKYVLERLCDDISLISNQKIVPGTIYWNAGSLHIYERHFKYLEEMK